MLVRIVSGLAAALVLAAAGFLALMNFPQPLFAHSVSLGRLSLHSDLPFDPARGRAVLADIEARLETSPLDDHKAHGVYITNAQWRRQIFFLLGGGATGLNVYPLTNNIFVRHADVDTDTVFGPSGEPRARPRTLAYYAAHEISHSFTAEHLGLMHGYNRGLPQWVREGYADYVGMGSKGEIDVLYQRCVDRDPDLDFIKSHSYVRFRLQVAYMLEREHWTLDQLLASRMRIADATKLMNDGMAAANPGRAGKCI